MEKQKPSFKYRRLRAGSKAELHLDPMMAALKALHSAGAPDAMTPEELERQRKNQDILGKLATPMAGLLWEPFTFSSIPAAWLRLHRPERTRRVILYCHGGGYTSGNLGYARNLASKLCRATGLEVMVFEYRLAPEHPYPAALEDALAAWGHLLSLGYAPGDILVAGDSAGGHLAVTLCLALKQQGRPLPRAQLLFSPWADLTLSGRSIDERAAIDPILTPEYLQTTRDAFTAGADPAQPLLSPIFADLTGLPPALIQVGSHEILYSDSLRLSRRLKESGVPCRFEVWEDLWHVFQMFPGKKSDQALENIAYFLIDQL